MGQAKSVATCRDGIQCSNINLFLRIFTHCRQQFQLKVYPKRQWCSTNTRFRNTWFDWLAARDCNVWWHKNAHLYKWEFTCNKSSHWKYQSNRLFNRVAWSNAWSRWVWIRWLPLKRRSLAGQTLYLSLGCSRYFEQFSGELQTLCRVFYRHAVQWVFLYWFQY